MTPKLYPTPRAWRQEEKAGAEQEHQAGQPSPTSLQTAGSFLGQCSHLPHSFQPEPELSFPPGPRRSVDQPEVGLGVGSGGGCGGACPPGGDGTDGLPVDGDELVQDHNGGGEDAVRVQEGVEEVDAQEAQVSQSLQ